MTKLDFQFMSYPFMTYRSCFIQQNFEKQCFITSEQCFIGWVPIKKTKCGLWRILAGVAITATGCLCYLIPTVGWIAGGIITSAGISGLMEAVTNPDGDNWDFLKSVGIGGLIGALSLGLGHLEIGG